MVRAHPLQKLDLVLPTSQWEESKSALTSCELPFRNFSYFCQKLKYITLIAD